MREKFSSLSKTNRLILGCLAFLFVLTIIGGIVMPILEKRDRMTRDEVEAALEDTVWTRETKDGTEGLLFKPFQGFMKGTLQKSNGKLSPDTEWLMYEVVNANTLYLDGEPEGTLEGDHEIELKDAELTFDGKTFIKQSEETFNAWNRYSNDYSYYSTWTDEEIAEREQIEQGGAENED